MFMSLSAVVLFTPVSSENISRVVTFVLFVSCIVMHSSRMCFWFSSVWPHPLQSCHVCVFVFVVPFALYHPRPCHDYCSDFVSV